MTSVTDRCRRVVSEHLGRSPEDVTLDADLIDDLGADSLDCVELAIALEEEFGGILDDAEVEKVSTFADMVALVERVTA